ncbi:MAG: FG-GAP-like repeat-containing protein, partial [Candidatus Eisenbacteria bacterium]|nr:FG-GAP-like repeat-containing protein [Candidatus Eisenbacteria bacterium]
FGTRRQRQMCIRDRVSYALPGGPSHLCVADLNADSIPDVALPIWNVALRMLVVCLGVGDGTFHAPVAYGLGGGIRPECLAIGDLNSDGIEDLATANMATSNVSILLGRGDGTFLDGVVYPAGVSASFVTIVPNLNQDDIPDLAIGNLGLGLVTVLLGTGGGAFAAPVSYSIQGQTAGLAVGDVTGDGVLDILAANYYADNLAVLRGHGDGTFETMHSYGGAFGAWIPTLADINGDEKDDLIVPNATDVAIFYGTRGAAGVDEESADESPARWFDAAPNPLDQELSISFRLSEPGQACAKVYDTAGRVVATLVDEPLPAGTHFLRWQPAESETRIPSGVYFVRITADGRTDTRRVTLLR